MKKRIGRKQFIKNLGIGSVAFATGIPGIGSLGKALASTRATTGEINTLANTTPPLSNADVEIEKVYSACWQCVSRDPMIAYKEKGTSRITHLTGNPNLPKSGGKLCAKGQGGIGQIYDPDRILFPMKQTKTRGDDTGWVRIAWSEARSTIGGWLHALKNANTPEKFVFHYGRMKTSSETLGKGFCTAFGTGSVGGHTAICEAGKWNGQELIWGKHYEVNDVANSKLVLNFGSNPLEAHTSHISLAQKLIKNMADNKVKLYTFDVRLSNTAAKSTEWIPVNPGTDLAIVLAMMNHLLAANKVPQAGSDFISKWTSTTIADLKAAVSSYTPAWAEGISGVPAAKIQAIAEEYAANSPGSTIISYRGAVAHYNGGMTEFAINSLEALCGNIYVKGGRTKSISGSISATSKKFGTNTATKKVSVFDNDQNINGKKPPMATHHVDHMVLRNLEAGKPLGTDGVYFIYCYDPVYSNPNWEENVRILKDTTVIPHYVASVTAFSEAASLADIILPDTTYLERWDWETNSSYANVKEYFLRQPIITPLGEAKNTQDFLNYELALDLGLGYSFTAEEFVKAGLDESIDTAAKGGSAWMIANGGFTVGDGTKYAYHEDDKGTDQALKDAGYVLDTYSGKAAGDGTWWDPKEHFKKVHSNYASHTYAADAWTVKDSGGATIKTYTRGADGLYDGTTKVPYLTQKGDTASSYKAQKIGDKNYAGFGPDKLNKSGLFEVKSHVMTNKITSGLTNGGLPEWIAVPEHQSLGANEFILTTYKVAVQIHSRSQNCKYLSERYHENFALMHPETASKIGVVDGDNVKITNAGKTATDLFGTSISQAMPITSTNNITIKAKVSYGVKPGVIAISHHCGHTHYGRYATANKQKNPLIVDATQAAHVTTYDKDADRVWWTSNGTHPNRIIPNSTELFGGMQRWMDTVVTAAKA